MAVNAIQVQQNNLYKFVTSKNKSLILRAMGSGRVHYPWVMDRLPCEDTWVLRSQPNQIDFKPNGSVEELQEGKLDVKTITETE
ncbi:hypothetical protein CEP54_011099 [Fusarium duplospermum]|uniref:Uncharacterized protein n=1 Tax=Fusarium duplospermum TaxID=1325734 RepID=A0A428PGE1_9HYPO|nr:hypothetical protein CEP54_011099 [Fusarium duplospermum]